MNGVVLCDIDNCISDDGWRLFMIDRNNPDPYERYAMYHTNSIFDEPKNLHILQGKRVVFVTARPETWRQTTTAWLEKNVLDNIDVQLEGLLMRQPDDHTPSCLLKPAMADAVIFAQGRIEIAYDDRPDVVKAYHVMGVRAELMYINKGGFYECG